MACKAESAGLPLEKVSPAYTSPDCSACGHRLKKSLANRRHRCSCCGLELDRDINAAINIMRGGTGPPGVKVADALPCPQIPLASQVYKSQWLCFPEAVRAIATVPMKAKGSGVHPLLPLPPAMTTSRSDRDGTTRSRQRPRRCYEFPALQRQRFPKR